MPRADHPGLKPTHKLVQAYYAALAQFDQHRVTRETAVRQPFLDLLRAAASPRGLTVEAEFPMSGARGHRIVVDAALRDAFWRLHGYWEPAQRAQPQPASLRHPPRSKRRGIVEGAPSPASQTNYWPAS